MKTPAEKFRQNPAPVYRAADKGESVVIEHNHYKDKLFLLTAVDKTVDGDTQPLMSTEEARRWNNFKLSEMVADAAINKRPVFDLPKTNKDDLADMQIDVKAITGPKEDTNED